jgi:hypothetical protein
MSQQLEDTLPSDAPEFFSKYAGKDFLNDFTKKYSVEDATKMLVAVDDIVASGDKKAIFRAKDALSWSSELQHDYFVNATNENRYEKWAAQSPINKVLTLAQSCIEKSLDKISEKGATEGLMALNTALYAGVAVAATTMGLPALAVGAIAAVPLVVRVAHECHEKYEEGKSPFEKMTKLMEFADTPASLKQVMKNPENMPLRKTEMSIVNGTMAKEDVDGYREVALDRLKRTINEMPASVKLLSHFKPLDELIEMADKYQEKLKTVPFSQRDAHRRSFAIDAFKETNEAKPGVMNVVLSKLMNEASIEGATDAFTSIKSSISDKLAQRRAISQPEAPTVSAKAPAFT